MSALLAACLVAAAWAQQLEYMVPMRDGVELHTLVNFPFKSEIKYPVVIDRSPYGANKTELIALIYLLYDHVAVRQDMRGTQQSQGNFTLWRKEDLDFYDTAAWIVSQSWSNGKIYTVGASADGLASFPIVQNVPPNDELAGQFLIFASDVGYPIMFPGGAYSYALVDFWIDGTIPGPQDPQLLLEIQQNEGPGAWWNPLNLTGHYGNVTWPSVMWSGWYDIFLVGQLHGYDGYQHLAAPGWTGKSKLVIDPLGHCQKASTYFPKNTILGRVLLPLLLSFDMVQGSSKVSENVSAITWYVMGSNDANAYGQYWVSQDTWPVYKTVPYYLQGDGTLAPQPSSSGQSSQSYVYDPSNPVPTMGGNNLQIPCGPIDQTPVESRPDVLSWTSKTLTAPLALTGPLTVTLWVSSNCTDTDFTAKLTDVYPTGESRIIQDGIVRMRWREYEGPVLMQPGQIYEVTISLWNTSYIYSPGHSLRVSVSSSNYPRYAVNPNNGEPLTVNTTSYVAENTVYHSSVALSRIDLPVVQLSQLPEFSPILDPLMMGDEQFIRKFVLPLAQQPLSDEHDHEAAQAKYFENIRFG